MLPFYQSSESVKIGHFIMIVLRFIYSCQIKSASPELLKQIWYTDHGDLLLGESDDKVLL